MKVLILGGDGFCGWPTALELSRSDHEVHIIDNFSRRHIDSLNKTNSLTPIAPMDERIKAWKEETGKTLKFCFINLKTQYSHLVEYLKTFGPEVVIHFAEQRSAPYSMKNSETKRFTIENNITITSNVLNAINEVNRNIHLIHLGTMGVYGYDNQIEVNEGYICAQLGENNDEIKKDILFPFNPGSIYHLTKCMDSQMFQYFHKAFGLKITDLHQGIVWGTQTPNTMLNNNLLNRFDYDSDYGTVLNRFLVQANINIPLTLYGTGNQQRAFININDSITFIKHQVEAHKIFNKVDIINQMTEIYKLSDIAKLIVEKYPNVKVENFSNPRKEIENNNLKVNNNTIKTSLSPRVIKNYMFDEIELINKFKSNVIFETIIPKSFW